MMETEWNRVAGPKRVAGIAYQEYEPSHDAEDTADQQEDTDQNQDNEYEYTEQDEQADEGMTYTEARRLYEEQDTVMRLGHGPTKWYAGGGASQEEEAADDEERE